MTHSLHREGRPDQLEGDYCVFIYPARGFNYKNSQPRVRNLTEIVYANEPVNVFVMTLRESFYSEVTPEQMLDSISKGPDGARVYACFESRDKVRDVLKRMKDADEGVSIVCSGLIEPLREIAVEAGLRPHTINLSLGLHGDTKLLPPPDIRLFTTMCGHGMVSPQLVRNRIMKVKQGKMDAWEAGVSLTEPCACGIFNPRRAEGLLHELAPVYTVSRY